MQHPPISTQASPVRQFALVVQVLGVAQNPSFWTHTTFPSVLWLQKHPGRHGLPPGNGMHSDVMVAAQVAVGAPVGKQVPP